MGIYQFLKKYPKMLEKIAAKAKESKFHRYLLEEYYYRKGLKET